MRIHNLIARFLVNKTTKEEWNALETWKQESQDNLNELLEMQSIWNDSIDLKDYKEFDKNNAWDLINSQIEEQSPQETPKKSYKILQLKWAAGIAATIAIILFSIFTLDVGTIDGYNHITADGLIESFTLPDGSDIYINRNSAVDYATNFADNRSIILDGEAYFDVARDEESPFTIVTDEAEVTVLGTSFNIEEHDGKVDIYVTSGKVKVVSGENEVILSKNEMVSCSNGRIEQIAVPSGNYLSWKSNKLIFEETPLHKVVQDLSRHYHTRLVFSGGSKAMNQQVTDIFEGEDFESVLETLVLITGIKYNREGNTYIIQ
ncbi:FecR family protein [Portibacter marinus]|uniref:FecR family protein n=1 Tax=Portibacter marinus TaxID=2898660 RepID=UPI001F4295B2|nr:FecR domain-containing protein [Portibacter marinus]